MKKLLDLFTTTRFLFGLFVVNLIATFLLNYAAYRETQSNLNIAILASCVLTNLACGLWAISDAHSFEEKQRQEFLNCLRVTMDVVNTQSGWLGEIFALLGQKNFKGAINEIKNLKGIQPSDEDQRAAWEDQKVTSADTAPQA